MQVEAITQQPDASAWSAVVRVQGLVYVASYVAARLTVKLGPYKHPPRRPRWHLESVRKWAEQQVAALPAEWIAAHRAMYQEAA